ncbi:hypothetical protein CRV08_08290 [Halarcobacter ebronensis]|uniref:HTH tetR-type domain-containing protein n=1 Tax=Halarcobacter ebronensis TaxID=1462615 RepID=A0A4Q0YCW8_9BACT|nr:TetR/AcrR family transcriptional regulator [Halarcobacter ebronensis]RXJ68242.1 hypothetical protein CRV08_08290 [Halarcobacter ebronensis]
MKKRNAEETKALILSNATILFAKYGYDGMRVDNLAEISKINKATIYYHFKDKSFIFETILLEMSKLILDEIKIKVENENTIEKKLEAFLDAVIHIITTKRDLAKIMMQELALNSKNLSDKAKEDFFKIIKILTDILDEGKKAEKFIQIDPFLIHSMVIGSINYYYSMKEANQNEANQNFKVPFYDNAALYIKEMVLKYILK